MDGLEDIPHALSGPVPANPITFPIPRSEVDRVLPARDVTRDSIYAAYVQFILFCNPAYDIHVDTVALVETFSSPPTSNKKVFPVFDVFLHVKRLYELQTRTWTQLALDLGVEPASAEEGSGASQRVHQYIVRLKKWMRLTHADAFFHFLIGKPHDYYLKVPPLSDPHPAQGRDGITTADDLALRALDPSLRPKRGRKRVQSSMEDLPREQRHSLSYVPLDNRPPMTATPMSAFPRSASDLHSRDPWSSVSLTFPTSLATPIVEPRSAYTTFSASPRIEFIKPPKLPKISTGSSSLKQQAHSTVSGSLPTLAPPDPEAPLSAVSASSSTSRQGRQRLQLQVPDRAGDPVRLMTALVSNTPPHASGNDERQFATNSAESYDQLKVELALALLQAPFKNTRHTSDYMRLTHDDALRLAREMLRVMGMPPPGLETLAGTHLALVESLQFSDVHTFTVELSYSRLARLLGIASGAPRAVSRKPQRGFHVFWTMSKDNLHATYRFKVSNPDRLGEPDLAESEALKAAVCNAPLSDWAAQVNHSDNSPGSESESDSHPGSPLVGDEDSQTDRDMSEGTDGSVNWQAKWARVERENKTLRRQLKETKDRILQIQVLTGQV